MTRRDLESRIQGLVDGNLPPEERTALLAEVGRDPEVLKIYWDYAVLECAFTRLSRSQSLLQAGQPIISDRNLRGRTKRNLRWSLLATAAVLLLVGVLLRLILISDPPPTVTLRSSPDAFLEVSHALEGEEAPAAGTLTAGSRARLSRGTVELTFANGTRSIVRGPADLTLHDEGKLLLHRGTAWFRVPPRAVGFQVQTPDMTVTDLGTEFGVISQSNAYDEVHVFDGKVQLTALRVRREEAVLAADQARLVNAIGRLREVKVRPEAFLTALPGEASLLVNGGFDNNGGSLEGWKVVDGDAAPFPSTWRAETDRREIGAPQEGTHFAIEYGDGSGAYFYQAFATVPKAAYEVSFSVARPHVDNESFGLQVDVFNGGGVPGGTGSHGDLLDADVADDDVTSGGAWVSFRYRFTAASSRTTLRFLTPGTTSIDAAVDTVAVMPIDVPGTLSEGHAGKQPSGKSPRAKDGKNAPSP